MPGGRLGPHRRWIVANAVLGALVTPLIAVRAMVDGPRAPA